MPAARGLPNAILVILLCGITAVFTSMLMIELLCGVLESVRQQG